MDVRYYESPSGGRPVEDYLEGLPEAERVRIAATLADIVANDLDRSTVVTRQIEGKLWELKISRHRVFYVLILGPVMVLLHAYKKQGQKAPRREIEVAMARMKKVLE